MGAEVELARRACAGDVQALAALLERHRPSLYAASITRLGNRADALDAVQDTSVIALVRLRELRDPAAAKSWLHAVLRNVCLLHLRQRREVPTAVVEPTGAARSPEDLLEESAAREWVWQAIDSLSVDERLTVILRYFTRCTSYDAIARVTAVPVGTVRSRLNRARRRLVDGLQVAAAGTLTREAVRAARRDEWEDFYRTLHNHPVAATYRDLFAPDVEVRDTVGRWTGLHDWSAHERDAITLGVRATVLDVLASDDVAILEIDFSNPDQSPDHCPPHATFVHRIHQRRSTHLRIHYPDSGWAHA